jgi:hypothetical protein
MVLEEIVKFRMIHLRSRVHARASRIIFEQRWITNLLLSLLKVEKYEFIIRETTFGQSQSNTVSVCGPTGAIKSKGRHFRGV